MIKQITRHHYTAVANTGSESSHVTSDYNNLLPRQHKDVGISFWSSGVA